MRKFSSALKKIAAGLSVCILAAAAFISLACPVFCGYSGRREVYFKDGSFSEGIRAEQELGFYDLIRGRQGEAITTDGETAEKIVKDLSARLVFRESFSGGENAYYYTEKLRYIREINGKRVNIQVCVTDGAVKVGTPMIYGGF